MTTADWDFAGTIAAWFLVFALALGGVVVALIVLIGPPGE